MVIPLIILLFTASCAFLLLYCRSSLLLGPLLFTVLVISLFNSFVPVDLVFGLHIRDPGYFEPLRINDSTISTAYLYAIQSIVLFCLVLISSVLLPYKNVVRKLGVNPVLISTVLCTKNLLPSIKKQKRIAIVLLASTIVLLIIDYSLVADSLDAGLSYKHARIEARSGSTLLTLVSYAYNIVSTFGILSLLYTRSPFGSISFASFTSTLMLTFYFSQTSNLVIWLLAFSILNFKSLIPTLQQAIMKIGLLTPLLLVAPFIKFFSHVLWVGADAIHKDVDSSNLLPYMIRNGISFSKIEGLSSFEIVNSLVRRGNVPRIFDHPVYLDSIYALNPLSTYNPISVIYEDFVRGSDPGGFSFSPLAEAIVNTGNIYLAPVVSAGTIFVIVYFFSQIFSGPVGKILLFQAILRLSRLDLYSLTRRYLFIELLSTAAVLVLIRLTLVCSFSKHHQP